MYLQKHETSTYDEELLHSDYQVSISSQPPVEYLESKSET